MEKLKAALVGDHQIVRDGIKMLLADECSIEVITEAGDSQLFVESLSQTIPHVAIVGISLPGLSDVELTRKLTAEYPHIKVIILSMHTSQDFIFNAIRAGTRGLPAQKYHPRRAAGGNYTGSQWERVLQQRHFGGYSERFPEPA